MAMLVVGLAGFLGPVAATSARFSDVSTVATGSVAAVAKLARPIVSCGLLGVGSVRINWTPSPGADGYVVRYSGGPPTEVDATTTSFSLTGLISGGTVTVQAFRQYPEVRWSSDLSNSLSYSVLLYLVGVCS